MGIVVLGIVGVSMNEKGIANSVPVDDWIANFTFIFCNGYLGHVNGLVAENTVNFPMNYDTSFKLKLRTQTQTEVERILNLKAENLASFFTNLPYHTATVHRIHLEVKLK